LHGTPNQFWNSGYFQDDIKVTPYLTINLGVRYDYFQRWKEKHDHWASFDPATNQIVYAKNATDAQGGRALQFSDPNNFGPRFGFAWRPLKSQDLVLRGGYGIYYEQEHPSGPILNAINPPPGGIGAPDAAYSGFGFTRDFTAPALSVNPAPTLLWNNFSRGTAAIPARVAVNAVDSHLGDTYVQQWNVALQKRIGESAFEVAYVANKANKIFTSEDIKYTWRFQFTLRPGHGGADPSRFLVDQLAHDGRLGAVSFIADAVRAPHALHPLAGFLHVGTRH